MLGKCGACATSDEAKKAILNYGNLCWFLEFNMLFLVYGNTACPDTIFTYDDVTGYCYAQVPLYC
jgi:hypothetical protein